MKKLNLTTWIEINEKIDVRILPKNPTKLRLLADQNIPIEIVNDFKKNNIAIKSIYELNLKGHPDENILQTAKKLNHIILTTDKDFWNDKKHSLQKCFGIFCIDAGPQDTINIYRSFILLHYNFARFISNEFWNKTKVLLKTNSFVIKRIQDGIISETEYKFSGSKVYSRDIR